jgi:hypothetical protein
MLHCGPGVLDQWCLLSFIIGPVPYAVCMQPSPSHSLGSPATPATLLLDIAREGGPIRLQQEVQAMVGKVTGPLHITGRARAGHM